MAQQEIATLSLDRYTPEAKALISEAQALADAAQHAEVAPLHLLAACLRSKGSAAIVLARATPAPGALAAAAEQSLGRLPKDTQPASLSLSLLDLMQRAEREAARERGAVQVAHVLSALVQEVRGDAGEILAAHDLGPGALKPHLLVARQAPPPPALGLPMGATLVAGAGQPSAVVGRETELERALTVLERRTRCNLAIVGEPGVGKAALVRGLVGRIDQGQVPVRLRGLRFVQVDLAALGAGGRLRGEFEQRVRALVDELERQPSTVLCVIGMQQLLTEGSPFFALLEHAAAAVSRKRLRFVATVTPEGRQRLRERLEYLSDELTDIVIEEPTEADAERMVHAALGELETHHQVSYEPASVKTAVQLARRYLPERRLPDSCLDLLDESAARARIAAPAGTEPVLVAAAHVAETLFHWTGVPVAKMLEQEAAKLASMHERLSARVVGQAQAVARVVRVVRRSRVGLRDPKRPIGSFLFLGPTGVGKTELAKALAEFLFDDEQALTRMDMSEYMERHMAQRLLGAPPGYVDSERGGVLTEAVRRRPYSVLLFDEVEKAHQDVFNLLLQVLDDGRLTDGRGRVADFTNTVVIMTSNIGSARVLEQAGRSEDEGQAAQEGVEDTAASMSAGMSAAIDAELRAFFRPEFLNRIGDVVIFQPLGRAELRGIIDIQLGRVRRMLEPTGVELQLTDEAKARLVELGFEPALGARPLQRAIVTHVQDPLAEGLLSGHFQSGARVEVRLAADGQTLELSTLSKQEAGAPRAGD